jgi:hypothetical protein
VGGGKGEGKAKGIGRRRGAKRGNRLRSLKDNVSLHIALSMVAISSKLTGCESNVKLPSQYGTPHRSR